MVGSLESQEMCWFFFNLLIVSMDLRGFVKFFLLWCFGTFWRRSVLITVDMHAITDNNAIIYMTMVTLILPGSLW